MTIDVTFLDSGREPRCKADPRWPKGKPISLAPAGTPTSATCTFNVPYPAPRCGVYIAECKRCGFRGAVTVAGRTDDPNMITMPCKVTA